MSEFTGLAIIQALILYLPFIVLGLVIVIFPVLIAIGCIAKRKFPSALLMIRAGYITGALIVMGVIVLGLVVQHRFFAMKQGFYNSLSTDPEVCKAMDPQDPNAMNCFANAAVKARDTSLCEQIAAGTDERAMATSRLAKNTCYRDLAQELRDPSLCDFTNDVSMCRGNVAYHTALDEKNLILCPLAYRHEDCVIQVREANGGAMLNPSAPECRSEPEMLAIGREQYPILAQYEHLGALGEMITAAQCNSSTRLARIAGVEKGVFTKKPRIVLVEKPSQSTQSLLLDVGFVCVDNVQTAECMEWILQIDMPVSAMLRLESIVDEIEFIDCTECG